MVEITMLGADDWERLRTLRLRALADEPDAFWATSDEEADLPEAAWRARLEREGAWTFAAALPAVGDVGLAVLVRKREAQDDGGLNAVWVDPRVRGGGVAEELVRAVVDHARRLGLRRLLLDVGDHNTRAVRLYERLGFRPTGGTGVFLPPREHITEHERVLDLPPGT